MGHNEIDAGQSARTPQISTGLSLPRKSGFKSTSHTYKPYWFTLVVTCIFKAHFGCHGIQILGKSPIKWRHRHMTMISMQRNKQTKERKTNLNTRFSRESFLLVFVYLTLGECACT